MVGASSAIDSACQGDAANTALCKDNKNANNNIGNFIKNLVNTLLYVLGAVSVIVIILSGVFYVTSGGDSNLITRAKNTLIYAVVGLIVALLAYAIVNFVLVSLKVL
ncbi:hypothetical protein HGB25_00525 [Candidatus Saccharibacteria bacterium]|nr:hypothetical protein [Candidatus Saccharibacteria bacterium]